jgi:hypothetical protein
MEKADVKSAFFIVLDSICVGKENVMSLQSKIIYGGMIIKELLMCMENRHLIFLILKV